ncbi:MAG: PEP-CTERM sorting domain-containing protein [Verrucomicrobiota bacterium JB024]|nr:PEP-CTERM sorting domain-containing protein [Verrucomicrobiota bacterium JB024]
MKTSNTTLLACCALLLTTGAASFAQTTPQAVSLGGNTKFDGWTDFSAASNPGYGSFPGSGTWPGPIYANDTDGGSNPAGLVKVSNGSGGGPYPASGSLYFGGFSSDTNVYGGTLAVQEDSPLANLATLVFQVEIGEVYTYDYYDDPVNGLLVPSLTLNYGDSETITLVADYDSLIASVLTGTVEMPTGPGGTMQEEPVYQNLYGYQWDVSGYDNITSFDIEFSGVQHAQLYSLQLNQSDLSYGSSMIPVPEPATWAGLFGVAALAFSVLRRRRASRFSVARDQR